MMNTTKKTTSKTTKKEEKQVVKKSKFALAWEDPKVKPFIKINDMRAVLK